MHAHLLCKNRHLPFQHLLYFRIKTVSVLLLLSQCFYVVVTCLTCLCSVCNLSLIARMNTCSLNAFQWLLPPAISSQACCSSLRTSPGQSFLSQCFFFLQTFMNSVNPLSQHGQEMTNQLICSLLNFFSRDILPLVIKSIDTEGSWY